MATQFRASTSQQPPTASRSPLRCVFSTFPDSYVEMQPVGSERKYYPPVDADGKPIKCPLTDAVLRQHLSGTITVAAALVDERRMGRAAVADIDHGGPAAVRAAHAEATRRGYLAWGFWSKGAGMHNGGYLWVVFNQDYPADLLNALTRDILIKAGVEGEARAIRTPTRLPFGWHLHSETYGHAIGPQGNEYDLNDADERRAALRLFGRTVNDQAPPEVERKQQQPRPLTTVAVADVTALQALRQLGADMAAWLKPGNGWRDPATFRAVKHQLENVVNPAIKTSTAALFKRAFTCGDIYERHGAVLMRDDGRYKWYGGLPGDPHSSSSPKHKVDTHTGRCFGVSPNGRPGNDTKGHDSLSLERAITGATLEDIADSLTGPITPATRPQFVLATDGTVLRADAPAHPEPSISHSTTPEQRRAWAEAKKTQRQQQRDQAAATRAAAIDAANSDPRLMNSQGQGNIAFVVLLALLDFMGLKTWCRPSVATLAAHIGCSEGHARRGLAVLEDHYITTARNLDPETGELWSGGKPIDTPIRTLRVPDVLSSTTPQTEETGQTLISVDVCHDLVTNTNQVESFSNRQAPPTLPPATAPAAELPSSEPEPVAFVGGASFDPAAAVIEPINVKFSLLRRPKAYLSDREQCAALSRWEVLPDAPASEAEDKPQQQPIIADAPEPKPKRRRSSRPARPLAPGDLLTRYYRALGRADRLALDPATRRQAEAIRRDAAQIKAQYDALQATDASPAAAAPGQDGGRLSVTSAGLTRDIPPEPSPEPPRLTAEEIRRHFRALWARREQEREGAARAA